MESNGLEFKKQQFQQNLAKWFKKNGRTFPWRSTSDPYSILMAEMMLRRTTAAAVSRVYPNFMNRFNTPKKLAQARITTIESMIVGLGLQKTRAKHLQEVGIRLSKEYNGVVPSSFDELVKLPGVGRYVASAVLNFAFEKSTPLVDGNVLHLLSRVFGIDFVDSYDDTAWKFIETFGPIISSKILYWSIIDLVALICLRQTPRCSNCPISNVCEWYADLES